MSSAQADPAPATTAPAVQYVPILYDPARRRRRRVRARGGTTTIGGKPFIAALAAEWRGWGLPLYGMTLRLCLIRS
jgi:hypothetical protein